LTETEKFLYIIFHYRGDDVGKADTPISVPFGGSIEFIKSLADKGW
jgi:hypothetical protein